MKKATTFRLSFLNYASIAFDLAHKMVDTNKKLRWVFYRAMEFLLENDSIFNDRKQLLEYNTCHNNLYFSNTCEFEKKNNWTDRNLMEYARHNDLIGILI